MLENFLVVELPLSGTEMKCIREIKKQNAFESLRELSLNIRRVLRELD
jgi:hypothetical protein